MPYVKVERTRQKSILKTVKLGQLHLTIFGQRYGTVIALLLAIFRQVILVHITGYL